MNTLWHINLYVRHIISAILSIGTSHAMTLHETYGLMTHRVICCTAKHSMPQAETPYATPHDTQCHSRAHTTDDNFALLCPRNNI